MINKNSTSLSRVISKKVEKIKKLEKEYWKSLNEHRKKLLVDNSEPYLDLETYFPKEQSSLIYACIDGAIVIRHSEYDIANVVQIQIIEQRISKFSKNLPMPYKDGTLKNLGVVYNMFGGDFRLQGINQGEIHYGNLQLSTLYYNEEDKILEWEDALTDIKMVILGSNFNINIENETSTIKDSDLIIQKLELLINDFIEKLKNSEKEEELQIFLKDNPILIQPYSTVYPKHKLGEDFITDFILANTLDQGINYTFVEIERAHMPIFTKNGEMTADFNHAFKQTLEWDAWYEENSAYLKKKLNGLEKPSYLIIAGRSINFTDENRKMLRAWNRRQTSTEFLTYDDILTKLIELKESLLNQIK